MGMHVPLSGQALTLAAGDSLGEFVAAWELVDPLAFLVYLSVAGYAAGLYRLQRRSGWRSVPRRQIIFAAGGLSLVAISVAGPLDVYAERAFFIHMTQHLALAMFAAPLLLAASPVPVYLWALPERVRLGLGASLARRGALGRLGRFLVMPPVPLLAFVFTFYIWHVPAAYGAALENNVVHYVEHLTMFASGVLFWWPIIGPAPMRSALSYPRRMLYLLLVVTPKALLAAIITLSDHVLYQFYVDAADLWGISDAEDQKIAGLLMWVPGNLVFLGALTALFFKWYEKEEGSLSGPGSGVKGQKDGHG